MLFLVICLAVFVADTAAGAQVSPWSLYLIPLLVAGWLFGARAALGVAMLASALSVVAALISGHPFASWWEFSLSWGNRTICLLAVAWLIGAASSAALRRSFDETQQSRQ